MNQSMRRGEGGRSRRHETSRPGSRNGSVYDERAYYDPYLREKYERDRMARDYVMRHYHQPQYQYPMGMPGMAQPAPTAAAMLPDRAAMDTFEKHWKYYLAHPAQFEQLKVQNVAQYESLNNYYKMCGEYLRLPPIVPVAKPEAAEIVNAGASAVSRPESVHSGQSENKHQEQEQQQGAYYHPPQSQSQGGIAEESAIFTDPNADPRYQPTFVDHQSGAVVNGGYDENDAEVENYDFTNQTSAPYEVDPQTRMTPVKFSSAHVKGVFGALGQFAKVTAKNPADGQSASVEFYNTASLFSESAELAAFPGPLVPGRTHKGEVIQYCQSKIASTSDDIADKESYKLLWELLILLLRQKNAIDGSDIAELLLKDRDVQTPFNKKRAATNIEEEHVNENGMEVSETDVVKHDRSILVKPAEMDKVTGKFRDYLLFGHKKEGLEYAMKHGLWGHALFLASKMDERSYSTVMLR